jgi:hypothetical protein
MLKKSKSDFIPKFFRLSKAADIDEDNLVGWSALEWAETSF